MIRVCARSVHGPLASAKSPVLHSFLQVRISSCTGVLKRGPLPLKFQKRVYEFPMDEKVTTMWILTCYCGLGEMMVPGGLRDVGIKAGICQDRGEVFFFSFFPSQVLCFSFLGTSPVRTQS